MLRWQATEQVLPPQCGPEATCALSEKAAPFSEKQNQEEEGALTLNSGQTYINGDEKAVQNKSSS